MKLGTKLFIASRHLRSRAFQTFSVVGVIAFSVGLAVALFLTAQGLQLGLTHAVEPFELIVGAKGSPYQLLLNTVFLQDAPIGNIPWEDCVALSDDARVSSVVPLGFGDFYKAYPLVGTTSSLLNVRVRPSEPPWLKIEEGRWFDEGRFEAVLGAQAAARSGLRVGDDFLTSHGIVAGDEHSEKYRVVGIAGTLGGPWDRAVFVPLEILQSVHEHEGEHEDEHEGGHESAREVTAVLVHPASYADAYRLAVSYQNDAEKQLIFPAQTAIRLFSLIGRGEAFLSIVVYAVGGCALLTTLLVLYWSGAARSRERALLSVLGLSRKTLFFISWLEGAITLLIGVSLGELAGRAGAHAAFALLGEATAIQPAVPLTLQECLAPAAFLFAGSISTLIVAWGDNRV
ncbi:MAG: ABC transporter permease [Synergistaceae bacterium]|nr:ABC transporter permease [Synergistaceae bacterium]